MPVDARVRERVPETDNGLQGEFIAQKYDVMQRHIRDRGWLQEKVDILIEHQLDRGSALEIGTGPGYLGLEWLKATQGTSLAGLDISPEMLACAERNRDEYDLTDRATFHLGDAHRLPFMAGTFDCLFSYGSLHEWSAPTRVLDEIHRVLRSGGRYCVIDLRRDLDRRAMTFMRINIDSELRAGFMRSVRASYLRQELQSMVLTTALRGATITEIDLGIYLTGTR